MRADLFDGLDIPPELIVEFFLVFSRFEFALKDIGYCRQNRHGIAGPNWEGFRDESTQWFREPAAGSAESHAIDELLAEPPRVQTGPKAWEPRPLRAGSRIAQALEGAQRVRNNLFHGGKHTPHSPKGRDEILVRSALTVLDCCLASHQALRESFEQPYRY
ncbi:hypothetical protein [Tahibacter aquaticus]|uniref:hypothetical protein n=1 Tax=Tahibacter aquaticus TaxID=520092 RepID=UPI00105DECBB|nr:hypothetical protein [Tahibacter aquaticus]